ncbi:Fanconi anemia group M protein [Nelusetta ayraudi]|uniref:Fanconi anemia group M protein n=1 Tax=Nelusetta ayraudi TaxID=303726 RepID=UPI003F70F245
MSGASNQRTLFQSWGRAVSQNSDAQPAKSGKKPAGRQRTTPGNCNQVAKTKASGRPPWLEVGQESTHTSEEPQPACEDGEDDDDLMLVAVYEAEKSLQLDQEQPCQVVNPVGMDSTASSSSFIPSSGQTYPDFPGFDSSSAKVWIYPTNYPIRDYQLKISGAALFQNTLVCLPTGLGKTFIAAVVMYNFYRWYPSGKIVFMAPTKPLVAQQIEACYKVMGIPQTHMAELTGSTAAKQRQEIWRAKRVFFLTPQVMVNDLSRETCPAQQIKCVVIDEAHKALGNHAYCQVVRQLAGQTLQFRILALSATPGGDTKSVQSVISNLLVSHIELRSDESPDIRAHCHQRNVEKVVVPLGEALSAHQARYLQVLEKFTSRLVQNRAMGHKDLRTLSKYQLILARDQFRKNPPPHVKGPQQGMLEGDFALCISLYHGYELLMQMGLRSLFFYIQGIMDGSREMSRARNELQRTPALMDLYHEMEAMFVKPSAGPDEPFVYSHPKLEKLEEVVLQHFRLWAESSADNKVSEPQEVSTRVMIFSSFRESVQEIAGMLNRHTPLIRVMTFMGQASAGKGVKGFTQKEQLEVVHRFRQGGFNTLVSTCVGEEGLDIGEVDLIVCFDAQKNPIRLVQRMGRTGRKRQGRIVVVLAEGREERTYNQSQSNKRSVYKSIIGNKSCFHLYPDSPRMLPPGVNPVLHKMHITCGLYDHGESSRRSARGRRSHCEGRPSLIHPQNLIRQGLSTSDGFLSSAEYSIWASTMKLSEDEAHPTLRDSHFLSLPSDPPPQKESRCRNPGPLPRELSLSEWRHWQHRALPTHAVDHSLRCQHFVKVMELIDGMREENEGECQYEKDLLPYLHGEDNLSKNRQKNKKGSKTRPKSSSSRPKPSRSMTFDLEDIDEDATEQKPSSPHNRVIVVAGAAAGHNVTHPADPEPLSDSPSNDLCAEDGVFDDRVVLEEDATDSEHTAAGPVDLDERDEDFELRAMFYLPKWSPAFPPLTAKLLPGGQEGLKVLLGNVAELLSRSPPPLHLDLDLEADVAASPPPAHWGPQQPFQVSFTLDVEDEDDDLLMMMMSDDDSPKADYARGKKTSDDGQPAAGPRLEEQQQDVGGRPADSPTWDEVFDKEDADEDHVARENGIEPNIQVEEIKSDSDSEEGVSCRTVTRKEEVPDVTDWKTVQPVMENSMDLFEDDEAFLQMTIPDISTPAVTPRTSLEAEGDATGTRHTSATTSGGRSLLTSPTCGPPQSRLNPLGHHSPTTTKTPRREHAGAAAAAAAEEPADSVVQHKSLFDGSHDFFSVNFDLCYSLEDSEEEEEQEKPPAVGSSTPLSSFHTSRKPQEPCKARLSTPQTQAPLGGENSRPLTSPLTSPLWLPGARRAVATPTLPAGLKRRRLEAQGALQEFERSACGSGGSRPRPDSSFSLPARWSSDSEDDVLVHKRRQNKVDPLSSPQAAKTPSEVDSPLVVVNRKRLAALNTSDEVEGEAVSDDDFLNGPAATRRKPVTDGHRVQEREAKRAGRRKGRQFLDVEAELSEEGEEGVSSDEDDGEELNRSLEGFVVGNTQCSQGLNDSEMHCVYLKSVRSPAVQGKFKMSNRNHHNMDIFSQVPEMDETYAEDSFVVGSEVEEQGSSEDEAEEEEVELMPEDSPYVDGKRQYATRRRVFLHRARARAGSSSTATTSTTSTTQSRAGAKTKRSRVIRVSDSSDEEAEVPTKQQDPTKDCADAVPLWLKVVQQEPSGPQQSEKPSTSSLTVASKVSLLSKTQWRSKTEEKQHERCRQSLDNQHTLSDELDFVESESLLTSNKLAHTLPGHTLATETTTTTTTTTTSGPSATPGPVHILVDSRCISSGVDLMASLRQHHAATVHVCSLDSSYFIVSNRMAVERHSQSDLAAMQNRKRLVERVTGMLRLFERVCLIVEKDRTKPGEVPRPFQRTRYYDSILAALVRTGVRLLWSDGTAESAALLAALARLEQRKGQAIAVPTEVRGQHGQQALQLYLSLPSVNYVQALSLSHNFRSVAQLINSSVEAIQKGGCMSRPRAEEIYRFLRYSCDSFLLSASKATKPS